jgi:hypothetical protein
MGLSRIGRRALAALLLVSGVLFVVRLLGGVLRTAGRALRDQPATGYGAAGPGDLPALRARFNQEAGRPRLLLLLSPT